MKLLILNKAPFSNGVETHASLFRKRCRGYGLKTIMKPEHILQVQVRILPMTPVRRNLLTVFSWCGSLGLVSE